MRNALERASYNVGELDKKAVSLIRAAVDDANRELERLRVNPDGYRGSRTVAQAQADIRQRGRERLDGIVRDAVRIDREAREELDAYEESRQPTGDALAAAEAAWRRLEPLVATGWTVGDLAALAARQGDAPALVALRARVPALVGAALGPENLDSAAYREAVAAGITAVDTAAEGAGLVAPEDLEARKVRRRLEALAPVIAENVELAQQEVAGQRSAPDLAKKRIAVGAAELTAELETAPVA